MEGSNPGAMIKQGTWNSSKSMENLEQVYPYNYGLQEDALHRGRDFIEVLDDSSASLA